MKNINWDLKKAIAKKMTMGELVWSLADCLAAVGGADGGCYIDEAGIYGAEIKKRNNA